MDLAPPSFGHPAPLRLLVVAARRDTDGAAWRGFAACVADPSITAHLLCGAAGMPPPPGIRIFQPFPEACFLAEAEPGFNAGDFTQRDADLLRRLASLLEEMAPDIMHLHDLAPFGMELIALLRREHPRTRILLSLTPDLARRLGILEPLGAPSGDFLRMAPLRRFLAETTLLLPCESLLPACLAFGLDPARLLVHAPLPPAVTPVAMPPLGRFLVVAAFPEDEADAAMFVTASDLIAKIPAARGIRLELHGGWEGQEALMAAASHPGSPIALLPGDAPRPDILAAAHLALLPHPEGADPEGLAQLALAQRRPVICAGQGPLAAQVQAGRDGWHIAMNGASLADLLLSLHEAPGAVAAMAEALLEPPSPEEAAAALVALYREAAADPARIAPPERL